jgi:hypothetical protein
LELVQGRGELRASDNLFGSASICEVEEKTMSLTYREIYVGCGQCQPTFVTRSRWTILGGWRRGLRLQQQDGRCCAVR